MNFKLLNDSMLASQNEKGEWVYKANPEYSVPFKKNKALKQHYKDMPRFNVIIEAEDKFMKDYNILVSESIKEMAQVLNSFGH